MRALLLVLAVAACNDGIAIEVVVAPDSPATEVELFLAFGEPCEVDLDQDGSDEPCPGVGPPTDMPFPGRLVLPGEVFHVDSTRPFAAKVEDGAAWFTVDSADVELPVVIAVGTGANGPDSVAIARLLSLADGSQHIRIHLVPAGTALSKGVPGDNVVIWPERSRERESAIDTCVGAEFGGARVFIVPESNPDCDDVDPSNECNTLVFNAEEVAKAVPLANSLCSFEDVPDAGGTPFCRLGGEVCNEATGNGIGCANTDVVCASSHLCASCPRLDDQCVDDAFDLATNPPPPVSLVKCNVQLQIDPVSGTAKPCAPLSLRAATFGGDTCDTLELSAFEYPFGFATQLSLETGNGLQMDLFADTPTICGFRLHHSGEFPADGTSPPDTTLWTSFKTLTKTVMLPVVIHWVPVGMNGCPGGVDASTCDFIPAPNDQVALCFPI